MSSATNPASQISSHLKSKGLNPTNTWIEAFLSTQKPTTAIAALKQTALFRFLASDLTTSSDVTAANTFPNDIQNSGVKERHLSNVPVQIVDIEDISRSRWSQIEAIEAAERGETTRGREVIRIVPDENNSSSPDIVGKGGLHKLVLQDARGALVYAIESKTVYGVGIDMNIGGKMILTEVKVARGVILLEPESVILLGGKIDSIHKSWNESRKARLQALLPSRT